MSDNKTITASGSEKTPLFSSDKNSNANTKLRVKLLRGDQAQFPGDDDTQEHPQNAETNPPPAVDSITSNTSLLSVMRYGFLVSALLVAGYYYFRAYLSPSIDTEVNDFNTVSKQTSKPTFNPPRSSINRAIEISDIVSNLMKDAVWGVHKIHFFKKNWIQLDTKKQGEIASEKWFKQFQTALDQQINASPNITPFNKEQIMARNTALIELQEMLANEIQPNITLHLKEHADAQNVITSSSTELKDTNDSENNSPARIIPSTKLPVIPATLSTVSPPNTIKEVAVAAVEEHKTTGDKEEKTLLAKGVQAQQTELTDELLNEAESLHKPTTTLDTIHNQSFKGKSSNSEPPNTPPAKTTQEKKYYYVNGSIESLLNNSQQEKLTVAELNDLTFQLSNYYETGNLIGFASLFINDPDHENYHALTQIKKQFEDWLSGTSDRQMFIKELNWAFNKNVAIGRGEISLTLISNHDPRIVTIKKPIELVVKKENQTVYITKFEQSGF